MANLLTCCTGRGRKTTSRPHADYRDPEKTPIIEEPYSDTPNIPSYFFSDFDNSTLPVHSSKHASIHIPKLRNSSDTRTFDVNYGHVVSMQAQLKWEAEDYSLMDTSEQEQYARIMFYSWRESLAKKFLDTIQEAITRGVPLTDFLTHAFINAKNEAARIIEIAGDFAGEHPILTGTACAVVALGILYLTWPEVLPLLGFGELGPIEGSFAAFWQSLYGDVPYGSLFAYLQRLGMLVGK